MSQHDNTTPPGSFFHSATHWRILVPEPVTKSQVLTTIKAKLILKAYAILESIDWAFDNLLYPTILAWLGSLVGGIIMTILSALACYILLMYYIQSKEDWLGVDVMEEVKEQGGGWVQKLYSKKGRWWKLLHITAFIPAKMFLVVLWLLKKNDVVIFFTLSIYQDAFRTTAFLRHGRKGDLDHRDWAIFWASIAVSNVWWTFRWSIIIVAFKKVFL